MRTADLKCYRCFVDVNVTEVQTVVGCRHCGAVGFIPEDLTLGLRPMADVLEENQYLREEMTKLNKLMLQAGSLEERTRLRPIPNRPDTSDGTFPRLLATVPVVAIVTAFVVTSAGSEEGAVVVGVTALLGAWALFRIWTTDNLLTLIDTDDDFYDDAYYD